MDTLLPLGSSAAASHIYSSTEEKDGRSLEAYLCLGGVR